MEQWLRSLLLLFAVSDLCGYAILNVPKLSFHSRLAAAEARKTSTRVHVTNDGDFQDRDESDERTIYGDNPCVMVVDPMDVSAGPILRLEHEVRSATKADGSKYKSCPLDEVH